MVDSVPLLLKLIIRTSVLKTCKVKVLHSLNADQGFRMIPKIQSDRMCDDE